MRLAAFFSFMILCSGTAGTLVIGSPQSSTNLPWCST